MKLGTGIVGLGVLILGWPMAAEQFYNYKLFEGEDAKRTSYEHIVAKIELFMNVTEKGIMMRKKVGNIKDENGYKGSSVRTMDEFLFVMEKRNHLKSIDLE